MKFLKYFFFALLPIMLLMMFFSYNNFSFLGSKAGASSISNTINFYGKNNYLIGSYQVPNGLSINDVIITDTISSSSSFTYAVGSLNYSGTSRTWNSDNTQYVLNVNGSMSDNVLNYSRAYSFTTSSSSKSFYYGVKLDNIEVGKEYRVNANLQAYVSSYGTGRTYNLNIMKVDKTTQSMSRNNSIYSTTIATSSSFANAPIYPIRSILLNTYNFDLDNYDYFLESSITVGATGTFKSVNIRMQLSDIDISYSDIETIETPLSTIIDNDIETASQNGYINLQENYSWSTQSNFNNGFTFDTLIFYDLDLYYLQDNKVFDFSNGWQSTLGELSNLPLFTTSALSDLISDFKSFQTLNFNGDFLQVLKSIGLAIANIFNVIISLSSLIVAPILDLVSIIVLMITKSSYFWTFT